MESMFPSFARLVAIFSLPSNRQQGLASMAISYPPARRVDVVDKYQSAIRGPVAVADPYRWMHEHTAERDAWIQGDPYFTGALIQFLRLPYQLKRS